jgi:CheY-like chemotaxis protein
MPNFHDMLQVYLWPFAIAVPVGLLLIFFGLRKGREEDIEDIPQASEPRAAEAAPMARVEAPPPAHGVSVTPGGGIDLPLSSHEKTQVFQRPAVAEPPPDTVLDEDQARPPARLLVVDDSAVPRAKLKKLFETAGYDVVTAGDGVEALEALNKAGGDKFNLIITDLEMPNLDGFGLIEAVQGSMDTEDIPVIAITGHDEMQARVHNIQGLFGIFKKPWNDRELLKRVEVLAKLRT